MATVALEIPSSQTNRALLLAVIVVVIGVLATSLPQTQGLGVIPIRNLLKNALHATRESSAAFVFWATIPWYFKPLVGMVQDAFPLFRTRRRSYMLVGSVLSSVAWLALDITPYEYHAILLVNIAINSAMVIASTAVGGYMVEIARASASSGRLTSVRNAVEQFSFVVSGVGSGYLAGLDFKWTGITCGAVTFVLVPVAIWCLIEKPAVEQTGTQVFKAAGSKLSQIGKSKALWVAAAVAFLFYFAPGTQTAQFYAQQNDLHMTTQQQGNLVSMAGAFGVLAAFLYGTLAAKRFRLRTLLVTCIILGASGQASYFFYYSYAGARFIDSYWGFTYTLAEVAMMHLAVRATPVGCEALGFALMMAVRNFGLFGGDWFGAALQDHYHLSFHALAAINGAGSLLALPVMLLLPTAIVMGKDAQKSDPAMQMAVDPAAIQGHSGSG
jgi:predicted MFS family arabinose efflux permease